MRATKKTLFGLIAALAACIAATLLLILGGRSETAADQTPTTLRRKNFCWPVWKTARAAWCLPRLTVRITLQAMWD